MVTHPGIQDALGERLFQTVEKAVRIKGRLGIGPSQKLVQDGIRNMRLFASRHGWAPFHPSCPPKHEIPDSLRRILKAMITGETDPSHLAELGSRRLGCSRDTLVEALDGRVRDHHRFLLDQHLKTIEQLEETMAAFDARIEAALAPFRDTVECLTQVPGLSTTAAEVVIAEIGLDMRRFPTAGHLLSWAGLVPGLDESAGKRRSTRVTKGAPWLKPVLVQ